MAEASTGPEQKQKPKARAGRNLSLHRPRDKGHGQAPVIASKKQGPGELAGSIAAVVVRFCKHG